MMIIVNNPAGCWKPEGEKPESCKACYFSQVSESNQWAGDSRCLNSECIVYGGGLSYVKN